MDNQKTILDYFIDYLSNTQPSAILPAVGIGTGLVSSLLRRGAMPEDARNRDLMNSLLLGGLAGTGAEMTRYGGANALDTLTRRNLLKGTEYVLKHGE